MKVLYVSSGNSSNGISPIIKNQGNSLARKDLEIHYFPILRGGIIGYLRAIFLLRKKLNEEDFQLIHAHYSLSAFVASLAGAKPLVVSLMGSDVKSWSWYKYIISIFHRFFWQTTIVKSLDMKNDLGIMDVEVLPNGVDFDRFRPLNKTECQNDLGWNLDKKHILFPANPKRPEKNFALLEKALAILNDSSIECHFLVDVPNEKVPYHINASDIVVLPSLWEGSPNAVKETMACNKAMAATDVGDIEWLFGEIPGYFISEFSASSMAESIKSAIQFANSNDRTEGVERLIELGLDAEYVAKKLSLIYQKTIHEFNQRQ